jgi:hypothetical protein
MPAVDRSSCNNISGFFLHLPPKEYRGLNPLDQNFYQDNMLVAIIALIVPIGNAFQISINQPDTYP